MEHDIHLPYLCVTVLLIFHKQRGPRHFRMNIQGKLYLYSVAETLFICKKFWIKASAKINNLNVHAGSKINIRKRLQCKYIIIENNYHCHSIMTGIFSQLTHLWQMVKSIFVIILFHLLIFICVCWKVNFGTLIINFVSAMTKLII